MCLSLVTLQPANDPHQMLLMLFLVIYFLTPIYMPVFECILLVHFKNSNKIGHTYSQISRVYCICIDFTWSSHEVIHNGVCKGMSYQQKHSNQTSHWSRYYKRAHIQTHARTHTRTYAHTHTFRFYGCMGFITRRIAKADKNLFGNAKPKHTHTHTHTHTHNTYN